MIYDPKLLKLGKALPVMEQFYSLQGEGFQTGKAAYFVRIGGCDVGCRWCDVKESWNATLHPLTPVDQIVENVMKYQANSVVVTGGEPLIYNLDYLCERLHKNNIKTYIETSGSHSLSGKWDWICLSPKKQMVPFEEIFSLANELKMIIETPIDFLWAEENVPKIKPSCELFLQAEWSQREIIMPQIIDYIKKNPQWRISLQSHKYMNIP